MRTQKRGMRDENGSVFVLVLVSLLILGTLGLGLLNVAYGVRHRAIRLKNEAAAMLAAEAGYEKAIFWMSQQQDMLSALQNAVPGTTGSLDFPEGDCDYQIQLFTFAGSRPVYKIISSGHSGMFNRTVDVLVLQAASGWDMGASRVLLGDTVTDEVYFADGEIIDLPLHINDLHDNPDYRDIYILGSPQFSQSVAMGESRETASGIDKYSSVMSLFDGGIYFDQPDSRITDEATIQTKVNRFENSTKAQFRFEPAASAPVSSPYTAVPAVQLEFFVDGGVGKVRITNNCTILGYKRNTNWKTLDFKLRPGTDGKLSERYDIYAYHFMPEGGGRITYDIDETYVTQSIGDVESEPGGQIFVDGSVIIGGGDEANHDGDQVVKGKITVVASGNIWIADCVRVSDDGDSGVHYPRGGDNMPAEGNPNVLGLIAQGVIKVVDPGISEYNAGGTNNYPGPPQELDGFEYIPIGQQDEGGWVWVGRGLDRHRVWQPAELYERHLPDPMVLEAAITVGGGGWGAENVQRDLYGNRKEASGNQDALIVRGSITEAARGVVGLVGADGYLKNYYSDERLLEGVLPGDIWLRGKYIPAPAGWYDYRPDSQ
jgi:type II secretory pathway pseudopilin PulG